MGGLKCGLADPGQIPTLTLAGLAAADADGDVGDTEKLYSLASLDACWSALVRVGPTQIHIALALSRHVLTLVS